MSKNLISDKFVIIVGVVIALTSIGLSGFKDNTIHNKYGTLQEQLQPEQFSNFIFVDPSVYTELPSKNPNFLKVKQSIRIPISKKYSDGTGTAFRVRNGTWITARHVIEGCKNIYILKDLNKQNVTQNKNNFTLIRNIFVSQTSDLAVLTTGLPDEGNVKSSYKAAIINDISKKNIEIGDEGFSFGFPKGKSGQAYLRFGGYIKMIQSGVYQLNEPVKMWVEIEREPKTLDQMGGISGGPIFDRYGSVVGVHVANSIRRGRAFSVDEYSILWLLKATSKDFNSENKKPMPIITRKNWINIAKQFRTNGIVKKVYCEVN